MQYVTQAEEAPLKQLNFIKAWNKEAHGTDAGCWQRIIDTAESFLSPSQSQVPIVAQWIMRLFKQVIQSACDTSH